MPAEVLLRVWRVQIEMCMPRAALGFIQLPIVVENVHSVQRWYVAASTTTSLPSTSGRSQNATNVPRRYHPPSMVHNR